MANIEIQKLKKEKLMKLGSTTAAKKIFKEDNVEPVVEVKEEIINIEDDVVKGPVEEGDRDVLNDVKGSIEQTINEIDQNAEQIKEEDDKLLSSLLNKEEDDKQDKKVTGSTATTSSKKESSSKTTSKKKRRGRPKKSSSQFKTSTGGTSSKK